MKKLMLVIAFAGMISCQGCAGGLIGMGGLLEVEAEMRAATTWTQVPRTADVLRCFLTPYNMAFGRSLMARLHSKRRYLYTGSHSELSEKIRRAIEAGYRTRGMSRNEFRASAGYPNRTNYSSGSWGTSTQFVYGSGSLVSYYYFDNDRYTGSN